MQLSLACPLACLGWWQLRLVACTCFPLKTTVLRIESQCKLVPTIRRLFADVPRVVNACKLLVQIKDEDWIRWSVEDQVIPDRSVLNVIPHVGFLKTLTCSSNSNLVFPWQGILICSRAKFYILVIYCIIFFSVYWNRILAKHSSIQWVWTGTELVYMEGLDLLHRLILTFS